MQFVVKTNKVIDIPYSYFFSIAKLIFILAKLSDSRSKKFIGTLPKFVLYYFFKTNLIFAGGNI